MRFWDSSAVIPLLITQPHSATADTWVATDPDQAIWVVTPAEVTSALWRLTRDGTIGEDEAIDADRRVDELAAAARTVTDVAGAVVLARRLLRVHPLRAADALQLGAALVWADGRPNGLQLHTFDDRLARAARREGFEVQ